MRRITVEVPFQPRPWQRPLLDDAAERIVAVVHRRAGKSTALMWRGLKRALTCRRPHPRVVHILPYAVQWNRTGMWDQACEAARHIPGAEPRKSELAIRLPNGATWQAGGADNADSWRGGYADEVVVDEYDDTPPSLVPLVIEPMLADRAGVLVRSGTPKGNGLLAAAYERARTTPGYSCYLLDHTKTGALSPEALDRLRAEMSDEEFAQELECSFVAPNSGTYYGKLLNDAERDGRITSLPHDPRLPVTTAWDLGVHDSTSVWFAQITRTGEWRIIDHLSDSGAGLDHYVRLLQGKPYTYDRHLLPHDVEVTELGSGRSRRDVLTGLGVRNIVTVPSGPGAVADGINAVRMILPRCWFDAVRCAAGLKSLRHYRREWNEAAQVWRSAPRHDWASHDADAFRGLAVGAREPALVERKREFSKSRPMEQGSAGQRWMAA